MARAPQTLWAGLETAGATAPDPAHKPVVTSAHDRALRTVEERLCPLLVPACAGGTGHLTFKSRQQVSRNGPSAAKRTEKRQESLPASVGSHHPSDSGPRTGSPGGRRKMGVTAQMAETLRNAEDLEGALGTGLSESWVGTGPGARPPELDPAVREKMGRAWA